MSDSAKIIAEIAGSLGLTPTDINRHALLADDLNLGPVELSDLLTSLSDKFQVDFNPEDVGSLRTVDDLVGLVEDSLL